METEANLQKRIKKRANKKAKTRTRRGGEKQRDQEGD
jgi:hypothetical protein